MIFSGRFKRSALLTFLISKDIRGAMGERFLVLDYETFSEHDLKKAGAFEYAAHPSTEIICAGFAIGTREELKTAPVKIWARNEKYQKNFSELLQALLNPSITIVAHNAFFEQVITRFVFGKKGMYSKPYLQEIPTERWICTASLARSIAIPGNLEGAGAALGLTHQKDKEGHRLMLKLCKPKKPSKKDPSTRHQKPEELERLYQYCAQDVRTEIDLFLTLPALPEKERKLWLLDQRMNLEGFKVDRPLVQGALDLIDKETAEMDSEIHQITNGEIVSARQRNEVVKFLGARGLALSDLRAETVRDILDGGKLKCKTTKRVLEIREAASKSSTAKFQAFEIRSRHDGRARDNTIFFGAHTGRQSGTGLQPQNLFKTVVPQEDLEAALPLIERKDFHAVKALFDKPMKLYASALRSCIIAEDGHTLDVGDFATIEVRVLFWLAGHQKGLDTLASGKCLYSEQAGEIYGEDPAKILAGYKAGEKSALYKRTVGKHAVLGAGFGIGLNGEKFQAMCKMFGVEVSIDLAQRAVRAYRTKHPRIPIFWTNVEKAAIMAVKAPGKRFRLGHLVWCKEGNFLTVQLPIGRKLHYFKPMITTKETPWGHQEVLSYRAVNSVTKKFDRVTSWGGVLTENVVQACARDLLMEALLRLEESQIYKPILSVHDEIVCERKLGAGSTEEFVKLMSEVPQWAKGVPIKVEGWSEPRYRK